MNLRMSVPWLVPHSDMFVFFEFRSNSFMSYAESVEQEESVRFFLSFGIFVHCGKKGLDSCPYTSSRSIPIFSYLRVRVTLSSHPFIRIR